MCHLLTVGISKFSDDPARVFQSAGLQAHPAVNADIRAALPVGSVALDVTDGYCSCSIYRSPGDETEQEELARWRHRYEQRGWSDAKIARALDSKLSDRHRRPDPSLEFTRAVETIVRAGGSVVLVAHSFSGLFAEEHIAVRSRCTLSLNEYLAGKGAVPEDTVVTVQ